MVSASTWLAVIMIFITIVSVAVAIGWYIRNTRTSTVPTPPAVEGYTEPLVWGGVTAGPNPGKNYCQIYTFPAKFENSVAYIGAPTLNADILDGMTGITLPAERTCVDVDEIAAQQLQHTCVAPRGVADNSVVRCITAEGETVSLGATESYYSSKNCSVSQCPGQLSLVALNFHGPGAPMYCLAKNGSNPTGEMVMLPCDPTDKNQLFRITRTNPGQDPKTLTGVTQSGMLAQIYDRETDLCVVAGTGTATFTYYPRFLQGIDSSCDSDPINFTGGFPVLGSCTGGPYPGYLWAFSPSISYCGVTAGCSGCTGGATRESESNQCCIGPPSLGVCEPEFGYEAFSTPQQIYYIGDVYDKLSVTGTSDQLFSEILQYNVPRLYFGGVGSSGQQGWVSLLGASENFFDTSTCEGLSATSQYINLLLYNTLIQEEPCVTEDISSSYCFF